MTNTKFRKRALLSSVAMLLVALVALGSATFAWFTQNPNATAHGLLLKTSTSAGLVALSESQAELIGTGASSNAANYSHDTYLKAAAGTNGGYTTSSTPVNIGPASLDVATATAATNFAVNFYNIEAEDAGQYDAYDDSTHKTSQITGDITGANGIYVETIYLTTTGGNAAEAYLTNIKMKSVTGAKSIFNAVRVAITDVSGKVIGIYGLDTEGNAYLTADNAQYSNAVAMWDDDDDAQTPDVKKIYDMDTVPNNTTGKSWTIGDQNDPAVSIGEVSATAGATSVTVYVYLDGEDSTCYSENVNLVNLIDTLDITFSVASN